MVFRVIDLIKMFRDGSRIRKVAIVEDEAESSPKRSRRWHLVSSNRHSLADVKVIGPIF